VKQVLVVDDDPSIIDLFVAMAPGDGLALHSASNGAEALALFTEHRPELVFLDITMPGMSGLVVLKKMKQMIRAEKLICRIIMLTARSSAEDVKVAEAYGADGYLVKPIVARQLAETIKSYLAGFEAE
jgi:CheY-like chemotaxis protein